MRSAAPTRELSIRGRGTREWMLDARVEPMLGDYQISALGRSEAAPGFRFRRSSPEIDVLMFCTGGRGLALVDGQARAFGKSMAYLMPAHTPHAYWSSGRGTWSLCWICFVGKPKHIPIIPPGQPRLVPAETEALEESLRGLFREAKAAAGVSLRKAYLDLTYQLALRLARAPRVDERWQGLWSGVEADLAGPWTLGELARRSGDSVEALRLKCLRATGRSPVRQLAFLRMQRAAGLLGSTREKIATVAALVGYEDAFAFSVAFRRHLGVSPSLYRKREGSRSIH